jgi:tetratricopeptide (TPR) repeat protein
VAAERIDAFTQTVIQPARPAGVALVAADRLVVGEIPGEPPGFVDRAELVALARLLGQRGRVAVCAGGRGVGKSALAAAYVRAAIADADGPQVVVWVSGENELTLITGLAVLAQRTNLAVDGEDIEQTAARARDYLSGISVASLLVVDNAEDPERLRRWLPTTGVCRIVLTSTDQAFSALATPVQIGPYSRDESIAYLAVRAGIDDTEGCGQVAQALGDLPLALAQAAAVITAQRLSYRRYLTKLSATSLATAFPAAPGYPRGLAAAIYLSVQACAERHTHARLALGVLSLLDPQGVTRALLTGVLTSLPHGNGKPVEAARGKLTEDDVDQIIGVLVTGSLIAVSADDSSVTMHRLVGRTIREAQDAQSLQELLAQAASALQSFLPAKEMSPAASIFIADVTAQMLALLRQTRSLTVSRHISEETCTAATEVATWLYAVGGYVEMLMIDEKVMTIRERVLGPDHLDTLRSRGNLAIDYWEVGHRQEAIALNQQVLAARQRVLGLDHPDTLTSLSNLAADYRESGFNKKAIELDEQVLRARERVLGPDHPDTLISYGNLAADYWDAGDRDKAIGLDKQVLDARERVLGSDHPDTLRARSSLAVDYRELGSLDRVQEAIALDEATLAVRERVLGPDHPDTLRSLSNLSIDSRRLGRHREAAALEERVLAVQQRLLGRDHPDTLTAGNKIALSHRKGPGPVIAKATKPSTRSRCPRTHAR